MTGSGCAWQDAREWLRAGGVPSITGVWCPPETGDRLLVVVGLRQAYPGHATQVLHLASQCGAAAYSGRIVVVVDEDVDLFNLNDVLWAITTRVDPQRDVTILPRAWSSQIDPAIHPDERPFNSRLLIDATRPWQWREHFPQSVWTVDMERAARQKWGWLLEPSAPSTSGKGLITGVRGAYETEPVRETA